MSTKLFNLKTSQARWIILFSYLIALALDTVALFGHSSPIVPPLTLFVLLYWCAHFLDRTHLFSAFILGLLADTLYQTTLGSHALLFSVITFLMIRHRLRFKTYPVWQQAFFISLYMLIYQLLNYLFFSPLLDRNDFVQYWSMPAISILLWPMLSYGLRRISHPAASD